MFGKLLALFIAIPLIELALLIQIGEWLGVAPTIGLVVVTGILGASLARWQGFKTFLKIQRELDSGRIPANELLDGLMILIGGLLLLTPGLLTDLLGFSLLIPPVRTWFRGWLKHRFQGILQRRRPQENVIDV